MFSSEHPAARPRQLVSGPAILASLLLVLMVATATPSAPVAQDSRDGDGYVCPPCGCGQDGKVSDKPGQCTACRMKLIKQSELQRVAILLFDGVQIIDYAAPWEVLGQAGFEVFTVSRTGQPIKTAMGMSVNTSYSFENSPKPTILLVPGGRGVDAVTNDAQTIDWVRRAAGQATHVLSVCNGAFILAKAGLLDNQKATTFYYLLDELRSAAPGIQVVDDRRWVDNGKVITSAGLASGIDATLHLVSKIKGLAAAQQMALVLEYDWKPESGFVRGTLAVKYAPRLTGPDWEGAELLSTAGDRERWEARYKMKAEATAASLVERVKTVLEYMREWQGPASSATPGRAEGRWQFAGDDGSRWTGTARVEPDGGEKGSYSISIIVQRERSSGSAS